MNTDNSHKQVVGRLAPSPTGYLHLGNAWAFLAAWLGARSADGRLLLRLEDIDPQRSKPELALALQEDLRWLGLHWDDEPYTQSARLEVYAAELKKLEARGFLYPCFCSRKELRELAGAPQIEGSYAGAGSKAGTFQNLIRPEPEGSYPGTCRNLSSREQEAKRLAGMAFAWRIRFAQNLRPEYLTVDDLLLGRVSFTPEEAGGDFALRRSDGVFAYQLAVTLDDIAQGVTQVVRGEDILSSTPRQLFLYSLFGAKSPEYAHLPLLLDHEGERLAKRHASISLRGLRSAGVTPEAVIGWLAHWSGLRNELSPCRAQDLLPGFSFAAIKRQPGSLPFDIKERLLALR